MKPRSPVPAPADLSSLSREDLAWLLTWIQQTRPEVVTIALAARAGHVARAADGSLRWRSS